MAEDIQPEPKPGARRTRAAKAGPVDDTPIPRPIEAAPKTPTTSQWPALTLSSLMGASLALVVFYGMWASGFLDAPANDSAELRTLADRIAQVEGQRSRINSLENSVSRLETTRNSLASLQEKQESDVHRLETALREINSAAGLPANLTPLENKLTILEQKIALMSQAGLQSSQLLLGTALATLALKDALDKGTPFTAELMMVKNLSRGWDHSKLEEKAATGIATTGQLLSRFSDIAKKILNAPLPENASYIERIKHFFQNLVTVRPVGDIKGGTAEAILARVEQQLAHGNSERAYKEFQTLPLVNQSEIQAFAEDLRLRAETDALLRELLLTAASQLQQQYEKAQ